MCAAVIQLSQNQQLVVINAYRPPRYPNSSVFCAGDFNLLDIDWTSNLQLVIRYYLNPLQVLYRLSLYTRVRSTAEDNWTSVITTMITYECSGI